MTTRDGVEINVPTRAQAPAVYAMSGAVNAFHRALDIPESSLRQAVTLEFARALCQGTFSPSMPPQVLLAVLGLDKDKGG